MTSRWYGAKDPISTLAMLYSSISFIPNQAAAPATSRPHPRDYTGILHARCGDATEAQSKMYNADRHAKTMSWSYDP